MQIISLQQLQSKLRTPLDTFIIDVRDLDEYESGHIPTALHIPWDIVTEKIKGIKLDKELIVYCRTRTRALKAAHSLEDMGYKNIFVYHGGWEEWEAK